MREKILYKTVFNHHEKLYLEEKMFNIYNTMPFTFAYRPANRSLRYLSFERGLRRISCSVPKCEWHKTMLFRFVNRTADITAHLSQLDIYISAVRYTIGILVEPLFVRCWRETSQKLTRAGQR